MSLWNVVYAAALVAAFVWLVVRGASRGKGPTEADFKRSAARAERGER